MGAGVRGKARKLGGLPASQGRRRAEERQRCGVHVHRASDWGSLGPAVSVDRVVVCGLRAAESLPAVLLRAMAIDINQDIAGTPTYTCTPAAAAA